MEKLVKRNIEDIFALTPMQEGMLFHYLQDPTSDYYFEQLSLEICGEINTGIFEKAWDFVIETNEMLRTVFQWEKVEKPIQVILKKHKLHPKYYDFYDFPGEADSQKKGKLEAIKIADRKEKFDLRKVPFRVTLCRLEKAKHAMIISNHHILYDGWSSGIILKEFFKTYDDLAKNKALVKPVKPKFKEFVKMIQDQASEKQEKSWQEYLSGFHTQTKIPAKKRKSGEISSIAADSFSVSLSRDLADKMGNFTRSHKITWAAVLYSAWGILLQQYNSNNDILLDTTVSARNTQIKGIEEAVGLFINTLPLRVQTYPHEKIADLLARTDDMLRWWGDLPASPGRAIREHLQQYRQEYLFDSVLAIENYPLDRVAIQENSVLKVDSFSISGISQYDLTLVITVFADIRLDFFYKKPLFDKEIIEELADQFSYILKQIIEYPGENAAALTILPGKLKKKILAGHSETPSRAPGGYVAPGNRVEEILLDLWTRLFRIDKCEIGIDANFFDFGGHSLNASFLASGIHKELHVKVPLVEIFQSPTIRQLARYINDRLPDNTSRPVKPGEKIKYPVKVADLVNIHEPFPLTPLQSAYLMGRSDKFAIGGTSTHFYMEVHTRLDARRFNDSFNKVIARHPLMRAIVTEEGKQKILPGIPIYEIKVENLTQLDVPGQEEWISRERERMSHHIFDLSRWPLFEIKGLQLSHEDLYLLVGFDAMIADGHSFQLIARELDRNYRDPAFKPQPLEFTFRDYVLAAAEFRNSDVYAVDRKYWLSKLEYFPPAPRLPMVCNPADIKKPRFKQLREIFTEEQWITLQQKARENNITPSILLGAAYAEVLAYWSNQSDFALNLTLFNRLPFHPHIDEIVGNFTSLVLLEIHWDQGNTFMAMARDLHRTLLEDLEHRHYDGVEFIREISRHKNLVGEAVMPVVFTSTVVEDRQETFGLWDELEDVGMSNGQTSQVFLDAHASLKKNRLEISWDYVAELFDPDTIQGIFSHYIRIITGLITGDRDFKLQPPARDLVLWQNYNHTAGDIPPSLLQQMFEQQAAKTPGHIALEYGEQTMTYQQLDEQSNQVAAYLREQGVKTNECIAVLTTRGFATMVNVMGILKAGGVYVPIEPDYPRERRDYIYLNSNCRFILEPQSYLQENLARYPGHAVENTNRPEDPAYVIYTSGSTGRPKGVVITHWQAANTIIDINRKFSVTGKDRVLGISSMCFDLSVYDVFGTLSSGARLVLIPTQKDVDILIDALDNRNITLWNSVPAILDMVVNNLEKDYVNPRPRCALLSGDWIPLPLPAAVKKHFPNCDVISLGGATEGSIWSIYYPVTEVKNQWKSIPYGYPLTNQDFYVLNDRRQLCPVGVPGELYIGGAGVAAGYLNDVEKTKNAFRRCPGFGKIYKTGDYGVFHRDGHIEFLGRQDHQVKIRGYRVELGEIESCLLEHERITNALVKDRDNAAGTKYLCAYIVTDMDSGTADPLSVPDLKAFLREKLPEYMVPAFFVKMAAFPLTPNGKIDHKSLPQPEGLDLEIGFEHAAPGNHVQRKLAEVWGSVLGRNNIGINENFFMLGGDSIKTIQIASRMKRAGYKVDMKDFFQHPTIAELAPCLKKTKHISDQSFITGTLPLTPVQKEFFQHIKIDRHHFNQAMMLFLGNGFEEEAVKSVFIKLQQHHDALRMTYKEENGEIIQINAGEDCPLTLEIYDLRNQPHREIALEMLETRANRLQAGINLETGPLMKLGLFHLDDGSRLLIVIHHLVIDGVSWRILLEDIHTLYRRYKNKEESTLPLKTDSFKLWSERLSDYADSQPLLEEKTYWADLESKVIAPLKTDFPGKTNYLKDTEELSFLLSEADTDLLLKKVDNAFGTGINDILLTALALAIKETFGNTQVLLSLEGHGREEILEDVDIKRTVGWFTCLYPVILDVSYESAGENLSRHIKEIKESLRRIPNKGIGYGILKYLTAPGNKKEIDFKLNPQISFNYLGQFNEDPGQHSFKIAEESTGNPIGLNEQNKFVLTVLGAVTGNRLRMSIAYNKTHYKAKTIETLATHYKAKLRHIIDYCSTREKKELTPSDLTYKKLPVTFLDRLQEKYPLEDIYTLSPMQEGMLFQAALDKTSAVNCESEAFRFYGEWDIAGIEKSFNELFKRHHVLRTVFIYKDLVRPLQIVLKERHIEFSYRDVPNLAGTREEKETFIAAHKEETRKRPFDLTADVLMRLEILRLDHQEYEFTWTFHHIVMDGWCTGILISEFFEIYNSLLEKRPYQLPPVSPYRKYIQWLEQQDRETAEQYWGKYLEGFDEPTSLPRKKTGRPLNEESRTERIDFKLDEEKTLKLHELAIKHQVTMNTFFQATWGIILGKYADKRDIVFGGVVSGRSSQVENIESMVGLFINTIPVRVKFAEGLTFARLLKHLQEEASAGQPYHYCPLADIQKKSALKQELLDHFLVFQNFPFQDQVKKLLQGKEQDNREFTFELSDVESFVYTGYDFYLSIFPGAHLVISIKYNAQVYERELIDEVGNHLCRVIDQVTADAEMQIDEIKLVSEAKRYHTLAKFNEDLEMEGD